MHSCLEDRVKGQGARGKVRLEPAPEDSRNTLLPVTGYPLAGVPVTLRYYMEDDELKQAITEETRKVRRLRFIVDFALQYIRTQEITHDQAIGVVEGVKKHALVLFPDKEEAFDIIYAPRFKRVLNEKFKRS